MPKCAQCGQENPEGFKFCGSCGAALTEAKPPREVRKTVTVVFSDVSGSTALGERLDPESLRRVMSRYFDEMQAVVEAHEGTVEKFIGDAVMAVFGIPVLHEDDAVRAVRAATEMRERLAALNEELESDWGVTIAMRTGVNTGEVVAGDATSGQRFATGDAVNVAKRLEEAAPANEILLGESTYSLVRDAVEVEALEPLAAKGKGEPLTTYRLLSLGKGLPGRARRLDSPMVGRERELTALRQSYERAVGEQACHLFTVLGAAGAGKSRLVAEFLAQLGGEATIMRGRCLPYGEGITFWPLLEAIRGRYGDDVASAIKSELAGDENAELISQRIAAAVGLGGTPAASDETFWAVRKLFESLAGRQPLVVVFDDLQWGEPTFFDLVEHLGDWARGTAILIVCLARPELLDERPAWAGGKFNATSVLLERLSPEESTELVGNLLGRAELAASVQSRITDAAEGNPLFVEEMLAMLIDDGLLERRNGEWVATGDLSTITVPPTIHALLSARLDRLEHDERAVIERGSVEGKVFHRGAVAELTSGELRGEVFGHLQALVRKELIRPDQTDLPGEDAFRFRHLLIRDAAYDSMPKEVRADLHERFADWLDRVGGLHVAEYDEIVGYHLEQAYRYRAELAPLDEAAQALARRAGERLGSAAHRALERTDLPATTGLTERVLTLLPDKHPLRPRVLYDRAFVFQEGGDLVAALATLKDGLTASEDTGDRATGALIEAKIAALASMQGGSMEQGITELERLADELESLGDERGFAEVLYLLGQHLTWARGNETGQNPIERSASIAEKLGLQRLEASCISWIAVEAFWGDGRVEEGIDACNRILGRPGTSRASYPDLVVMMGNLKLMTGREEEARSDITEGLELLNELGRTLDANAFSMATASVFLLSGRFDQAEKVIAPACDALRAFGEVGYLSSATAELALALCGLGRYEEAEPVVEESKGIGAADDLMTQVMWRCAKSQILAARGEDELGLQLALDAVALANETSNLTDSTIASLAAANVYRTLEKPEQAREMLEISLANSKRKGNVVSVSWIEELLAEL